MPNGLWALGLALATPLLFWEAFTSPLAALIRVACAAAWFVVTWLLWRAHTFGGADAKGFAFFGLALSPVGYFDVWHGKFFPALDVLVASMLIAEILRRVMKTEKLPLFTVSQWPLLLAPVAGGLVWWPVLALLKLFVR